MLTSHLFEPANCTVGIEHCFCEVSGGNWHNQPVNTWSSLVFALVGILFLTRYSKLTLLQKIFAGASLAVGAGTFYYHSELTLLGQALDYLGVFALLIIVVTHYLHASGRLSSKDAPISIAVNVGVAALVLGFLNDPRGFYYVLYAAAAAVFVLFMYDPHQITKRVHVWASLGVAGIGAILWNFDTHPLLCNPASLFQPHAVWHLLSIAALTLLITGTKKKD